MQNKEIKQAIRGNKRLWLKQGDKLAIIHPIRHNEFTGRLGGHIMHHGERKYLECHESEVFADIPKMETIVDVAWLFKHIIEDWRVAFHPDDSMTGYINHATQAPTWTRATAKQLDTAIAQSFKICGRINDDFIYQISLWLTRWDEPDADDSITSVFGRHMLQEIVKA